MKIIKTGLSILTVILSCACQNWLDVQPKTEVKSDLLFESESGFKDANIGCYMMMGSTSLYGKELTSGLIDVLGQQWTAGISTTYTEIMKYNYDGAEYMINSIWANMYTTIANINNILENIDGKRNILQPAVYHIFKGEALGLRAFLHFELLKIFGWGDLENHPEYLKQKCIPYVKKIQQGRHRTAHRRRGAGIHPRRFGGCRRIAGRLRSLVSHTDCSGRCIGRWRRILQEPHDAFQLLGGTGNHGPRLHVGRQKSGSIENRPTVHRQPGRHRRHGMGKGRSYQRHGFICRPHLLHRAYLPAGYYQSVRKSEIFNRPERRLE